MTETVGTVASIIQLVDTALKAKEYIQDFIHAPQEQRKLLSEMADLRPLVQELQDRIVANASNGVLQRMKSPLEDFRVTMEQFIDKLRPGDGALSKFSKRLTWTMWSKKDAQEYLSKFEQFKSLLNSWLLVNLWEEGQQHQRDNDENFSDAAEQRERNHTAVTDSLDKLNTGIAEHQERIDSFSHLVDKVADKVNVVNIGVVHISDEQEREKNNAERTKIIDWQEPESGS
ncbi:hypothetical protein MVEN_00453300 [Mycena venus]|uniref:NACHT-NTPase and P-loop NTPases N-terminal domain-containing protein n=1 Tax=Mycena venus TaxID=2733690 RepID=A0A8H6YR97_9AGAR|nr:hypothetical protein MVEN_00453300 [Mycena venus]